MLCLLYFKGILTREKMSLQRKALWDNASVTCSRLKGVMQTEKRRCIQLEITGISLALVLNSSQMRQVSYEKEGFYFATKKYIVVTSYGSCKCHFGEQDIKTKNLLARSSSVYFLYLMGNCLSMRLLHVTYWPFQSGLKTFTAHS